MAGHRKAVAAAGPEDKKEAAQDIAAQVRLGIGVMFREGTAEPVPEGTVVVRLRDTGVEFEDIAEVRPGDTGKVPLGDTEGTGMAAAPHKVVEVAHPTESAP